MIQLGRYEELGSGVRKVNLYLPHYAPGAGKPVFEDGDMFKVVVPLTAAKGKSVTPEVESSVGVHDGVHEGAHDLALTETMKKILSRLESPGSTPELLSAIGYPRRTRNFSVAMSALLNARLIKMTLPDVPRSKHQQYRLTDRGRAVLRQVKMEAGK